MGLGMFDNSFDSVITDWPVGAAKLSHDGIHPGLETGKSVEAKWAARMVCVGSLLTLLYQVVYLALDRPFLSLSNPTVLILHLINIALFGVAVILSLNVGEWMRKHWKQVAFAFSVVMIASSTYITIVTGQTQPLFIELILFLAGTGPFLSWGEGAQAMLSVCALLSFGAGIMALPNHAFDAYQVLGILIAAAIGLFTTALERRLRRARWSAEAEVQKSRETLLLQERLRLAGQLASGIAHDLNNTLNVVKLRLSIIANDELVSSRHAAGLEALERAIEDAARTIARVRDFGQNRDEHQAGPVQLAEVIGQAIDLARSSIEDRPSLDGESIQLSSDLAHDMPAVRGSAPDMRQVFLNLLLNAADAVGRHGVIEIHSEVQDDAVVVRVSDNGSGIPDQYIGRIFQPFFTTKGPRGSGLGLSTAREIMEEIGGSLSASNRSAGGAEFTLRFPLTQTRREVSAPEPIAAAARGGCRFLLIDDDVDNLSSLREILLRDGHHVDAALSGAEAIEKLRSNPRYDFILCDLGMPGMNGWEVARQVSEIAAGVHFYIVTGWGREIERQIPSSVSVSGVLSKPIDVTEIRRLAAQGCPGDSSVALG
jgi:signal transduction histidine kinase/ActR/RegA family two-component response regulator